MLEDNVKPIRVSMSVRNTVVIPSEDMEKEGDIVDVICDCGGTHKAVVRGESGSLLEWYCPVTGEQCSDVNA